MPGRVTGRVDRHDAWRCHGREGAVSASSAGGSGSAHAVKDGVRGGSGYQVAERIRRGTRGGCDGRPSGALVQRDRPCDRNDDAGGMTTLIAGLAMLSAQVGRRRVAYTHRIEEVGRRRGLRVVSRSGRPCALLRCDHARMQCRTGVGRDRQLAEQQHANQATRNPAQQRSLHETPGTAVIGKNMGQRDPHHTPRRRLGCWCIGFYGVLCSRASCLIPVTDRGGAPERSRGNQPLVVAPQLRFTPNPQPYPPGARPGA